MSCSMPDLSREDKLIGEKVERVEEGCSRYFKVGLYGAIASGIGAVAAYTVDSPPGLIMAGAGVVASTILASRAYERSGSFGEGVSYASEIFQGRVMDDHDREMARLDSWREVF